MTCPRCGYEPPTMDELGPPMRALLLASEDGVPLRELSRWTGVSAATLSRLFAWAYDRSGERRRPNLTGETRGRIAVWWASR
jgi:hypothetical protein